MDMTAVAIIMFVIAFVVPLVTILGDDANWERKK